jgi:uncharacterized membrane protein YuzA (DUF378 family)
MKVLNVICALLLLIGGLNLGLMGIANTDFIAAGFGAGSALTHLAYILIGLSAIYKIVFWKASCTCAHCR